MFINKLVLICLLVSFVSYTICTNDTATKRTRKAEASFEGTPVVRTEKKEVQSSVKLPFPFTDKKMAKNQFLYEAKIEEFIHRELNNSNDTQSTVDKFPHNTDLDLIIQDKHAHLLLLDEKGLNLYTFSYDLVLSKCGTTAQNIKQLNRVSKKADIFKLNSMPTKHFKIILQSLLMESLKAIRVTDPEQEMALFITIHPSLTFLPAAVIEDTLENLRLSFDQLNIRYCQECREILPYDEYGFLAWYSASNTLKGGLTEKSDFFDPRAIGNKLFLVGINEKAIFLAYPLELASNQEALVDSDKLSHHNFCNNNHTFIQEAYYERGLEQFTDDIIVYFIKSEFKKKEISSNENIIYFPCFPENYWELMSNIEVYGSGSYKECKKLIETYIEAKTTERVTSDFGFSYLPVWPLENIDKNILNSGNIMVESDIIKQILTEDLDVSDDKKSYEKITGNELEKYIEKVCDKMFESGKAKSFSNSVKSLSKCIHLVYTSQMFKKMNIDPEKEVTLRIKNIEWIKGLVYENLITFHNKEREWWYQAQEKAIESYFFAIQQRIQMDKEHVLETTWMVIFALVLTFLIGFIAKSRGKDTDVVETLSKKR